MKGFCEKKFSSMLISGTFTKAVMYLMLLSDSIIAGYFVGASGVAGINAFLTVVIFYLEQMVFSDGDELCTISATASRLAETSYALSYLPLLLE